MIFQGTVSRNCVRDESLVKTLMDWSPKNAMSNENFIRRLNHGQWKRMRWPLQHLKPQLKHNQCLRFRPNLR